jgi:hypothetical protein
MPNTNPQAIRVANEKLRVLADRFGQAYNACKMAQDEYAAENWSALFPNDAEVIADGSATDGRTPITNADVVAFMTTVGAFITWMEATSNARRNNILKIAVNPERV